MPDFPPLPTAWSLRLGRQLQLSAPDGRTWPLEGVAALLVARLALEGPQPRDTLARQLWPDADPGRARGNLRQRLLRLKDLAGRPWIEGQDRLALAPDLALERPAGEPLLPDLDDPPDEALASWLRATRRDWTVAQATALQQQLQAAEAARQLDVALDLAARWVALEPEAEPPRRALARVHYQRHDRAQALYELDELDAMLDRAHGARPSAASVELRQAVEQAQPHRPQGEVPPLLLRPPRLVGRRAELGMLRRALVERSACLIVGEAGLGKSRLLAEVLADRPEALVVRAQAGDAGVPYATLARLLRRLLESRRHAWPAGVPAQALSRLLPELRGAAAPLPPEGARLLLQEALQGLWLQCDVRIVVVDDLHFADEASLERLQALIGDDRLASVAWWLAQRPAEGVPIPLAWQDALAESGRLQTLTLAPLDEAQVGELLDSLQLGLASATWAPRLHRHTGGNPLFVLETLKQLQRADVASGRLPPSATVGALIERRLRALSPAAMALARVAAVAGPDFGPGLAEQVSGRPALDLADAWHELEAAQVLRERSFAHDLVQEAVQRGIPAPIREHLHGAVARHLEGAGAEPARLAAHWLAAGRPDAARPWLLRAADAARDALRRREEAAFLEQAAAIPGGLPGEAHRLYMRAYHAIELVSGVQAGQRVLSLALEAATDDADRVRVLAQRAEGRTKLFELEASVDDGQAALALAERVGDDQLLAGILSSTAAALSMLGRHDEAAALMERHWPAVERMPDPDPTWYGERGVVLDNAGRPHEARRFHERAIAISRQRGLHSEIVIASQNLAVSLIDTGELPAAAVLLEQAESLRLSHDSLQGAVAAGWNLQAAVWRDLGCYRLALDACDRMLAADADQLPLRDPMDRLHRAWLWCAIGQWTRALQDLRADDGYPQLPDWVPNRARQLRARIAAARGLGDQGALARAREALHPGMLRTMRDSVALDLALADGDGVAAEALRAAAERDGFHGLRWSATWACARLAWKQGDAPTAARHAAACAARPEAQVPLDCAPGRWWHGLWALWHGLAEADRAEAARAEGVAWIHRTLQRELAPEFHASFREAVPEHRALLVGAP